MKAIVRTDEFKKAYKIVSACVSKEWDYRANLCLIAGRVEGDSLYMYALDGFRLSEYRINATEPEPGIFWIDPRVKMWLPAESLTITADEKTTTIDAKLCQYSMRNPKGDPLDINKLFAEQKPERRIRFNPDFMASMMRSFHGVVYSGVTLETSEPNNPMIIKIGGDENYRGMLLPMRDSK